MTPASAIRVLSAAFALFSFVVLQRPPPPAPPSAPPAPQMDVYVFRDDETLVLHRGDVVQPGERLRFGMRVQRPSYAAVIALDDAGGAALYLPSDSDEMPFVQPFDTGPFAGGMILDDATGPLRLVGVACWSPLSPVTVMGTVAAGRSPPGCAADRFELMRRR